MQSPCSEPYPSTLSALTKPETLLTREKPWEMWLEEKNAAAGDGLWGTDELACYVTAVLE